MNQRITLIVAALMGAVTVVLGASGAHSLKPLLTELGKTDTFELANRYQFFHVIAMLITALLMNFHASKLLQWASLSFLVGVICFSGSLYAMCFIHMKALGPVTPLGGLFFIAGWVMLALGISNKK